MATEKKKRTIEQLTDEEETDEEPGEVIESAPPLKLGEERQINNFGLRKKLLRRGSGRETPEFGDLVTVHCVGMLLDGSKFDSSTDYNQNLTLKLGHGDVVKGLDSAILTMNKGEIALFTLPPDLAFGQSGRDGVPPHSTVQFQVELLSWIAVVDVCKDGGIIKKIMGKGERGRRPCDLDEVLVKYQISLLDGTVVSKTSEEGIEFYIKDGHLIPALPKVIKTMNVGEKAQLTVLPQYGFGGVGKQSNDEFPSIPPDSVLNIDLELVLFKPVSNVSGDSKVIKKSLKEGEGTTIANEGAVVTVKYVGKLENGTVFEKKGVDGLAPLEFITDEEQVISGLDLAASRMKKGELALVTISPEYGFGNVEVTRDLAIVPPSSSLVYEIEMLDFIREKAPWEMTSKERVEEAGKKKGGGNDLFKIGKYEQAARKYNKASDYVSEEGSFDDEELKHVKSLRVSCWLNGAACSLKLNDFKGALKLCSKVLEIESQNIKALYRRAQAYIENQGLDLAELDIKKALEVDPSNSEVKLLQKALKKRQAESNKRDAKLYTSMFSSLTRDASIVTKKLKVDCEENGKECGGQENKMDVEHKVVDSS